MSLKIYKGLREIAYKYSHFLIDLWGVIHDGTVLFPDVLNCLTHLRKLDKKILFLTNAPRTGTTLKSHLHSLGLTPPLYDFIYSSGDTVISSLKESSLPLKGPYYFLGDDKFHECLLQGVPHSRTLKIGEADYILLSSLTSLTSKILEEGLKFNLPLICANPDVTAIHGGVRMSCPGSVSQSYADAGGLVFYYGKPHPSIYEAALKKFENPPLFEVLAIGDGLATDIKGANARGIDSVLIQGGIHHQESLEELTKKCADQKIWPTYVLPTFRW